MMVRAVPDAGVRPHRKAAVVDAVGDGTLTDADFRGCRWIEGDPSPLRPGMFCGFRVGSGESWCAKHRGVVFGEKLAVEFRPQGLAGGTARDGRTDAVPDLAPLQTDTSTVNAAG